MHKYPFDIDQSVLNNFCAAPLSLSLFMSPQDGVYVHAFRSPSFKIWLN
jgi:hypothetical protein